jgi:hypothetical protein
MKHGSRWLWWGIGVVVVLAGGLAILWWGAPPRAGREALRYEQGAETEAPTAPWAWRAARIESHNSLATSTSSSRSDPCRFACRSILVRNTSDHPLVRRAAEEIWGSLRALSFVERIDLVHPGQAPDPSLGRPDILVTIRADRLDVSGLPLRRTIDAAITVTASSEPASGRSHYYSDGRGAPRVQFAWSGALEHQSTMHGAESSGARFGLAATSIADSMAESLAKTFTEFHDTEGPMPELPDAFYPPHRPPPAFAFLEHAAATADVDGAGLMAHCETYWSFVRGAPAGDVLPPIEAELAAAGWRTASLETDEAKLPYLRMTDGARLLEVWPEEKAPPPGDAGTTESGMMLPSRRWAVVYQDRMTREEIQAAVDQLLDQDALESALLFERQWSPSQRERILARFEQQELRDAAALRVLADLYRNAGRNDDARRTVRRAFVASYLAVEECKGLENSAKALDMGDDWKRPPETAELLAAGGRLLTPGEDPIVVEAELDQPVAFVVPATDADPQVHSVVLRRQGDALSLRQASALDAGSRSWSTQAAPDAPGQSRTAHIQGPHQENGALRIDPLDAPDRFRITASMEPRTEP